MSTLAASTLKRAIITERSAQLKETRNQVVFEVDSAATKGQIKLAVESAYKVKVEAVNTMVVRGKVKRVGRYEGKKSNWKKAIVTLKAGDKIEVMEGV